MRQELRVEQRQQLNVNMELSIQMLQMDSLELGEFLKREATENPVLELAEPQGGDARSVDLYNRLQWLRGTREKESGYYYRDDISNDIAPPACTTLKEYLAQQTTLLDIPPSVAQVLEYLIGCLDSNGYLPEDGLVADNSVLFAEALSEAIRLLQALEPAGVGARSLPECLSLQLARSGQLDKLTEQILCNCLPDLAAGKFGATARKLQAPEAEIVKRYRLIRTLNPKPGAGFGDNAPTEYVVPDILVLDTPDGPQALLNENVYPRASVNTSYVSLIRGTKDTEAIRYITERARRAAWLCTCLQNRSSTLLNVASAIVRAQRGFFEAAHTPPGVLRLHDIAEELGIHESTVSRAVRGKYLQCRHGVFELRALFVGAVGDEDMQSAAKVKDALSRLLHAENPQKPLSDQKLCAALAAEGFTLSRRTVAKYREQLGIPNSPLRKRA